MPWMLDVCDEAVAELSTMPPDIRARFLRVAELV